MVATIQATKARPAAPGRSSTRRRSLARAKGCRHRHPHADAHRAALPRTGAERSHIPCRIESRSLLFETQEVRDLLTILAAIDDPATRSRSSPRCVPPGSAAATNALPLRGGRRILGLSKRRAGRLPADDIVVQAHGNPEGTQRAALVDRYRRNGRCGDSQSAALPGRFRCPPSARVLAAPPLRPRTGPRLQPCRWQRSLRQFVRFMERQAEEKARVTETASPRTTTTRSAS